MSDAMPDLHLGDWRRVADGVWTITLEPETVTVGLIAGSTGALLVDAGSSPAQGNQVREAIARVTDAPATGAVVTHWHYDHAFGLAAFADLVTVGHETVPERLRSGAAVDAAERLGLSVTHLAVPSRRLALATGFDLGGRRVEVVHLGRGHTDGDLVVVVPDADVIFAGDLIESAGPVWLGPDSYVHEWAGTLDGVIGVMTASTTAIPGHGPVLDRTAVFETRGRIAAVSGEIARLAGLGVPVAEVQSRGEWALPVDHIEPGLAAAYAQCGPRVAPGRSLPRA